jgi:hypothetical protein
MEWEASPQHVPVDDSKPGSEGPSVILTCSTYLSLPGKLEQFNRAMASLYEHHSVQTMSRISSVLVVNEYDSIDKTEGLDARVTSSFPNVQFIQKGAADRGQARTLNLILERIKPYDYWIHWEESWCCTRPFLEEAIDVMQNSAVTQLELTNETWRNAGAERLCGHTSPKGAGYLEVRPHPDMEWLINKFAKLLDPCFTYSDYWGIANAQGWVVMWPLYSLRPSINRVAFYADLAGFNEDPALWPVRFEWEFAARWLRKGAVKAVLEPPSAQRQADHVSTYVMPR